jgi:hypothetical protein
MSDSSLLCARVLELDRLYLEWDKAARLLDEARERRSEARLRVHKKFWDREEKRFRRMAQRRWRNYTKLRDTPYEDLL